VCANARKATLGDRTIIISSFEKTKVNNVDTLDTVATKSILVCISDSSISSLHISTIGLGIRVPRQPPQKNRRYDRILSETNLQYSITVSVPIPIPRQIEDIQSFHTSIHTIIGVI